MKHFFQDVPGLGNVAVSRHAQQRAELDGISEHVFERVLVEGKQCNDGEGVVWRELNGVRLVIALRPKPFKGAKLVVTAFRVRQQEKART